MDTKTEAHIATLLDTGLRHQLASRFAEAEQSYSQALTLDPEAAQSLYLLGTLAMQVDRPDMAEPLLQRAVTKRDDKPEYHYAYGRARKRLGDLQAALLSYRRAVELAPRKAEFHISMGIVNRELEHYDKARSCFERALELYPTSVEALVNLGNVHQFTGELPEAVSRYEAALALSPRHAEATYNLARVLAQQGAVAQAITRYETLIEQHPGHAKARYNLGFLYRSRLDYRRAAEQFAAATAVDPGLVDAYSAHGDMLWALHERLAQATASDLALAENSYRQALQLDNTRAADHVGLGKLLLAHNALAQAEAEFMRALELAGDSDDVCTRLAQVHLGRGDVSAALVWVERASRVAPRSAVVASSRLMLLNYIVTDASELARAHREFATLFSDPTPPAAIAAAHPDRQLRIGYLSADLRNHSVAFFIEPIIQHHDRNGFQVYCYHSDGRADAATMRLRQRADQWRECATLDDDALAQQIRDDGIDILVDLSGHSAGHRLGVMARRPAAVQASYLGYPGTTGLPSVDYRITDLATDPPGSEALSVEEPLRLSGSYFCYRPPADAPPVTAPPANANGFITFGSFNALYKLSDPLLDMWAEILLAMPEARLLLKCKELSSPEACALLTERFQTRGINAARLALHHWQEHSANHLGQYGNVDIALDTFPYNGATTTMEALWMGVPVVSLCGAWPTARMGRSILQALGLDELVTESMERYVATAIELAHEPTRVAALRQTLRNRMQASPLRDEMGFTRSLEAAYRRVWVRRCERRDNTVCAE